MKPPAAGDDLAAKYAADALALCQLVKREYVYFHDRAAYWGEACAQAQTDAKAVTTRGEGLAVLETLVDQMYDAHASLGTNLKTSPWLVPSGSDMAFEQAGERVVVAGVRRDGAADRAGVRAGDVLIELNGLAPVEAAKTRIRAGGGSVHAERMAWALNAAGAGNRSSTRRVTVMRGDARLTFELGDPPPPRAEDALSARAIAGVGYIRFNDSLGDEATVAAFDAALEQLRGSTGWIIDLRDTPSGGNTSVAEPIMGRFAAAPVDYQTTVPMKGRPYNRKIVPRGPWTATGKVVVISGHWTGSMGEGMAVGFDGARLGTVIGSPMAGLAGGVEGFDLPVTGIGVRFPVYGLSHVDGTPRQKWRPPVRAVADPGGPDDPALGQALALLKGS